ncbi:hypothetical protein H5410_031465 [Solanum commersonii]|uniref:Uncharacterized protein n=1 Tax=Solanum commersonii TaxID=4109 RepID=A0A9J5YJZ8_SOLCO|nr:hypothetical protein H5410_031465 [Solanum commersonii]
MTPTAMFISRFGPGHMTTECHKLLKCGHLKIDCFRLIGYPPNYKGKREVGVTGNYATRTPPHFQHYQPNIPPPNQYCHPHTPYPHPQSPPMNHPMPMFTPSQHKKLLRMLDQTTIGETNSLIKNADQVQLPTCDFTKVSHIGDCHIGGCDILRNALCVLAI